MPKALSCLGTRTDQDVVGHAVGFDATGNHDIPPDHSIEECESKICTLK